MPKARRKKIFTRLRITIIVSSILILFFVSGMVKEAVNRYKIDNQIAKLEQEIGELGIENSEIEQLITTWSESNKLEKEARLKLNLQKEGEKAVLILREGENNLPTEEFAPLEEEKSNIQKWRIYFFGH